MHPNALLELCAELVDSLLLFDSPADSLVSAFFRQRKALGQRERHTLAETAYAVLRHRLVYQHLAQSGRGPMARRLAILGWEGNEAFLRGAMTDLEQQWLKQVMTVDRTQLPERLRHNLPEWLADPLKKRLGDDEFWALTSAINESAPLDLRVNTLKVRREEVQAALEAKGFKSTPTPYSPWGLRLEGKPALQKLEVFTSGQVEVQDEGSQLLALLTEAKRGEMVVDFCAGAGGKTLALGASMRNTGRLYAFDVSGHRLEKLKPRLARSGLSNVYPVQITTERDDRVKRLAGKVDRVLVDAPCSGLGTLRRNPDLKWRQTPQGLQELHVKQLAILNSASRMLKPGGRLVYATCSLLDEENEAVASAFSEAHPEFEFLPAQDILTHAQVPEDTAASLCENGFLRLWPHKHHSDGFFAAVWTKK
ncbi:16S rRNA (cytosine967-C5)-methyltransferase [Roseateles sp. YR242]|uniref:RsmB/NOP family class I SAM-dependent RNA methyltransferase n=1 Tax=Roseateles sp. YR242 TaxID=1855305 RepID=UPI0008C1E93E|nr:RsmB/NOP family class I SAM-dependent RNA methyltransferase [Roseateles sp. YR242]SEK27540.1 16S rRNA (cytosine967-C5)-methyltransferase [Roseateles sp. YR242]